MCSETNEHPSFYWFVQVARNVVHCIAAGAVGEWWFGAHDVNTVQRAQTRALTTSLGSICLGSLLVAALNALHSLLLSVPRRKATGSANACLEFLVKLVTRNLQYFNKYAFCQVALYGKDFRTAGTDTMRLFRDRGWSALINDTLVSSVLSVGCLVVGACPRRSLEHGGAVVFRVVAHPHACLLLCLSAYPLGTLSGVIGSGWLYVALQCSAEEKAAHPHECGTFRCACLLPSSAPFARRPVA